ncbi:hypothetical protein DFJ77DRAFT_16014 [Powellomyces hirtus]|nr:hypothetical protein DFJ77DRAFT_16014 [Powellomyces hirtus]
MTTAYVEYLRRSGGLAIKQDIGAETFCAGLSDYERHRPPIPVRTDQTEIFIQAKRLNEEFTCPVCRNILRNTHVTIECMHRFCHSCIKEALFKGNKQCPACRHECHSMRNVRPDPRFDELIQLIHPNAGEEDNDGNTESAAAKAIAESTLALQKRYEEGMKRQWEVRRRGMKAPSSKNSADIGTTENAPSIASSVERPSSPAASSTAHSSPAPPPPRSHKQEPVILTDKVTHLNEEQQPPWSVEITLMAHPRDKTLPLGEVIRLRTTDQCTVGHLTRALREYYAELDPRLAHISPSDFLITLTRAPPLTREEEEEELFGNGLRKERSLELGEAVTIAEALARDRANGVLVLYHILRTPKVPTVDAPSIISS